jgi:hypothetical protein
VPNGLALLVLIEMGLQFGQGKGAGFGQKVGEGSGDVPWGAILDAICEKLHSVAGGKDDHFRDSIEAMESLESRRKFFL